MSGVARAVRSVWRLVRRKLGGFVRELQHPAGGPAGRLRRRLVMLGSGIAIVATVFALPGKVDELAGAACKATVFGLSLSDTCGALGLGGAPSAEERVAWEALPAGDCEALTRYVERFPIGAHRDEALSALASRRFIRAARPVASERQVRGYVRQPPTTFATAALAAAAARGLASEDARQRCADLGLEVLDVRLTALKPSCAPPIGQRHLCGGDYEATCRVSERPVLQRCG